MMQWSNDVMIQWCNDAMMQWYNYDTMMIITFSLCWMFLGPAIRINGFATTTNDDVPWWMYPKCDIIESTKKAMYPNDESAQKLI